VAPNVSNIISGSIFSTVQECVSASATYEGGLQIAPELWILGMELLVALGILSSFQDFGKNLWISGFVVLIVRTPCRL
jgi:hypothetical protein